MDMVQALKKGIGNTQARAIVRASQTSARPDSTAMAQAVQAAHSGIIKSLKDPTSAKFGSQDGQAYTLNGDGSLYAICGEVNAKNGFGGYSGQQAWIYVIPKSTIYARENGATAEMVQRDCVGGAHIAK